MMMMTQKQILVVEDNEINRAMLRGILSDEYTVLEAENGQKALAVLEAHKDNISLILLDIVMPVMDGYAFLSIMKAQPAFASIPVIVTTQSDSEEDEVAALSHGAADFVAKPYRPQVILHRVASIIHLRETAAMINQFQYDRLTGLYSKEFFCQRVREILLQHPERSYDIVCSDIENFKLINDVFGVPTGDLLLQGVADLYLQRVCEQGICGRFNADQFTCLLERNWVYEDTMFLEALAQVNDLSGIKNTVMKWGIYRVEDRTAPVEQMCDRALLAARSIKGQYGKHFALYDDELRSKLLREQAITDGMEAALTQGQFVIYLQPKYNIKDDQLAGAEALVRWNHPKWGFLSPAEFIPLFEKNGFITKLDQFVWDKACAVLREWRDKGYAPLSISVNVSRADVYQSDIAEVLTRTVEKYDLPPSCLHLEITESAYTETPGQIIDTVRLLRELGFIIEMDDFGSGYSSLNMLNQMPLDILKLDMKFIQSETAKPLDQGILRFIMSLARWMNLSVVAEGVETPEQLARLREIGCDYVQGYFFARPMPCEEFELLVRERRPDRDRLEWPLTQVERPQQILLVVDEDADYRRQVRETFQNDYRIEEVSDSRSALLCIARCEYSIAAAILSLTLPDAGSFSVLEQLQLENTIWRVPVITTGPADPNLEDRALEAEADDFIAKPHTQASLRRRTMRAVGIIAFQERERALRDEACLDYLTVLLNRRGLSAAAAAMRKGDVPFALYLFDLDNLKEVNDAFGHAEGDRLLKRFSATLRSHTRDTDILSRYGGDEFVVIMKQLGSEQAALKKGEAICRAFREDDPDNHLPAACSVGIVLCDRADTPISSLLTLADQALYRAKASNKGSVCLADRHGDYVWDIREEGGDT